MSKTEPTAAQRSLIGRIGGFAKSKKYDGREATAAARHAFLHDRFMNEVDPEGILPDAERQRRAQAARSEYFSRLALRAAAARRAKANRA